MVSHDKENLKTYPVDDENLVEFELESELLGGNGDRVEEAEAHRLCHLGVVARRPDDSKAVLQLSCRHLERKLDDRTCSLCGNKKCGMRGNVSTLFYYHYHYHYYYYYYHYHYY